MQIGNCDCKLGAVETGAVLPLQDASQQQLPKSTATLSIEILAWRCSIAIVMRESCYASKH